MRITEEKFYALLLSNLFTNFFPTMCLSIYMSHRIHISKTGIILENPKSVINTEHQTSLTWMYETRFLGSLIIVSWHVNEDVKINGSAVINSDAMITRYRIEDDRVESSVWLMPQDLRPSAWRSAGRLAQAAWSAFLISHLQIFAAS